MTGPESFNGDRGLIRNEQQAPVARRDGAGVHHRFRHPLNQPAPIGRAKEHDREMWQLLGLDQCQRLEQLVQGPKPAREAEESA